MSRSATNRVGLSGPGLGGRRPHRGVGRRARAGTDELPEAWRHFHVFLPTAEPCPYPILVNGAFSTDLSRQHVRVSAEDRATTTRTSSATRRALVARQLLPLLREPGVEAVLAALDRGDARRDGDRRAACCTRRSRRARGRPAAPDARPGRAHARRGGAAAGACSTRTGWRFRDVLGATPPGKGGASRPRLLRRPVGAGRRRPRRARADARRRACACSRRCTTRRGRPRSTTSPAGFELDPLLELARRSGTRTAGDERAELEERADARRCSRLHAQRGPDARSGRARRRHRVLPAAVGASGPAAARTAVHVPRAVLGRAQPERTPGAARRADEGVVVAVRRPRVPLRDGRRRRRSCRRSCSSLTSRARAAATHCDDTRALAAICQLAGRFAKPDRPLRYQRLQSDRALLQPQPTAGPVPHAPTGRAVAARLSRLLRRGLDR